MLKTNFLLFMKHCRVILFMTYIGDYAELRLFFVRGECSIMKVYHFLVTLFLLMLSNI